MILRCDESQDGEVRFERVSSLMRMPSERAMIELAGREHRRAVKMFRD